MDIDKNFRRFFIVIIAIVCTTNGSGIFDEDPVIVEVPQNEVKTAIPEDEAKRNPNTKIDVEEDVLDLKHIENHLLDTIGGINDLKGKVNNLETDLSDVIQLKIGSKLNKVENLVSTSVTNTHIDEFALELKSDLKDMNSATENWMDLRFRELSKEHDQIIMSANNTPIIKFLENFTTNFMNKTQNVTANILLKEVKPIKAAQEKVIEYMSRFQKLSKDVTSNMALMSRVFKAKKPCDNFSELSIILISLAAVAGTLTGMVLCTMIQCCIFNHYRRSKLVSRAFGLEEIPMNQINE